MLDGFVENRKTGYKTIKLLHNKTTSNDIGHVKM